MSSAPDDLARPFFMTRSVARVMGLNLSEAMRSRRLDADQYARMVLRCRNCALVEACEAWLGTRTCIATQPPPGCRITAALLALAGRASGPEACNPGDEG